MTEPQHDGDEELDQLYQALAQSRANTQRIEELIAERQGVSTAELHQRRRRLIRGLPSWITVPGLAALVRHHHTAAASGASAAVAAAITAIALTLLGPGHHEHHGAIPNAPAPPIPSASQPSPTAPTTSPTPSPEPTVAPPSTTGQGASLPPETTTSPGTSSPPATSPPAASTPPVNAEPTPTTRCLLDVDASVTLLGLEAAVRLGLCGTNVT